MSSPIVSQRARRRMLLRAQQEHDRAMRMAEKAKALLMEARGLERSAADTWALLNGREPTRSVLYRSAACLFFDSGAFGFAQEMAAEGLSGGDWPVPGVIADELRDVARRARREEARRGR